MIAWLDNLTQVVRSSNFIWNKLRKRVNYKKNSQIPYFRKVQKRTRNSHPNSINSKIPNVHSNFTYRKDHTFAFNLLPYYTHLTKQIQEAMPLHPFFPFHVLLLVPQPVLDPPSKFPPFEINGLSPASSPSSSSQVPILMQEHRSNDAKNRVATPLTSHMAAPSSFRVPDDRILGSDGSEFGLCLKKAAQAVIEFEIQALVTRTIMCTSFYGV